MRTHERNLEVGTARVIQRCLCRKIRRASGAEVDSVERTIGRAPVICIADDELAAGEAILILSPGRSGL
jgi:hypothetical protein